MNWQSSETPERVFEFSKKLLHAWGADILSYGEKCESVTYPGGILVLTFEGVDPGFCPEGIAGVVTTVCPEGVVALHCTSPPMP